MGHKTFDVSRAARLDDPERLRWMPVDLAAKMLGLTQGMHIADVGAGTGYFAAPFARVAGPQGKVWAVDMQPGILEILRGKLAQPGAPGNIEARAGTASATGLPGASCDLAFFANVWHELEDPRAALQEAARILKPGGRLAILDWRPDVERPPGPPLDHRIAASAVQASLVTAGWRDVETRAFSKYSYLITAQVQRNAENS